MQTHLRRAHDSVILIKGWVQLYCSLLSCLDMIDFLYHELLYIFIFTLKEKLYCCYKTKNMKKKKNELDEQDSKKKRKKNKISIDFTFSGTFFFL